MQANSSILIADDNVKTRDLVSAFLTYQGYNIACPEHNALFFDTIQKQNVDIVVADIAHLLTTIPDFLEQAATINPLLVLIAYGNSGDGMKFDSCENVFTLTKPLNLDELESLVMRAREYQTLKTLDAEIGDCDQHQVLSLSMIGKSAPMRDLFGLITKVAASNATVLIQGESGTGKELAARAIHQLSARNRNNFIPVNCAAIPDDLLESELFGHVKGSFTGAYANRAGRFEMADKGTLFLDEIGDMKANLQVKLLRVLQNREFEPVGASKSQKVDVRIVAATNKNLEEQVAKRDFREDLYYRLSVIPITIPPLRERREDIPLLVHTFLARFNADKRNALKGFSREAMELLCSYDWPGNVRELENLVERLVILKGSGFITPVDLPERYLSGKQPSPAPPVAEQPSPSDIQLPEGGICINSAVDEFENRLILQALNRTGGNKKEAALLLNLKRTTLIEKLKKKNLTFSEE
ncbi:MAG: sigma-54-dependent Fis family transcriptional regulator [Geobacteraceae bacterium GWC2_55_20]|nr:MAG: sigma-54-dependent Fis family transcriptional regulator [Geobacteraceae bacterium GWC2_55_20]HBA71780.1 sigma-54-dependent Fis family transcriptional regulator [Geobacter sp.]